MKYKAFRGMGLYFVLLVIGVALYFVITNRNADIYTVYGS